MTRKVLIVNDEIAVARKLEKVLEFNGYIVEIISKSNHTYELALAFIKEKGKDFDIFLLDYDLMGGFAGLLKDIFRLKQNHCGYTLARVIRRRFPDKCIHISTARLGNRLVRFLFKVRGKDWEDMKKEGTINSYSGRENFLKYLPKIH